MYARIEDLRREGITETQASDARLLELADEASKAIDQITGWFFEPRALNLRMHGRGAPSLEPPVPPIRIDRVSVYGTPVSLAPDDLVVVGAPVQPGFDAPRLTLTSGRFPEGIYNVEIDGLWGYTEADGTPRGRVPFEIRRVCILLVLRWLPPLADGEASDARNRWRVIEERTRDQSLRLDPLRLKGSLMGDPEVDAILGRFRRAPGLGAA